MTLTQPKSNLCPICRSDRGFMDLHGSMTCLNCKNKIAGCCGDGVCLM
jgi:hypothetical protein